MEGSPKKTLVIGASLKPERYSNKAILALRKHQHPVVAVGLRKGAVEDVTIEVDRKEFEGIHSVTMYIRPELQKSYLDYIVLLKPQRVIFNPGTENPEVYGILKKNGIEVLEACTLVLLSIGTF